jgi:nitrate reductase NapAB chaperone NapD
MAKPVKLKVDVDKNGKILVTIEGTQGTECLTHMAFLDNIPGLNVVETERVDHGDEQSKNVTRTQQVGDGGGSAAAK